MNAILNASVLYTEEEVWAEFKESCEAEADEPGHHAERLKRATEDLFQMYERKKVLGQATKKCCPTIGCGPYAADSLEGTLLQP